MIDDTKAKDEWPLSSELFEGFITEEEYARQRGVSVRTCQRDRALRRSPPYVLIGKQVFYRIAAVRAWFLEQERGFMPRRSSRRGPL